MRISFIPVFIFISSCVSHGLERINENITLAASSGVETARSKVIVLQFLKEHEDLNLEGELKVLPFQEEHKRNCYKHTNPRTSQRKYCEAKYIISHSSDKYCSGHSSVLENCHEGECEFEISYFIETCE